MRTLAEAVAQENVSTHAAIPSRHEELCIRTGKQTAECQFPVLHTESGASEMGVEKRTVKVTISLDGKSYIAHEKGPARRMTRAGSSFPGTSMHLGAASGVRLPSARDACALIR